jgi:hypothetical protein
MRANIRMASGTLSEGDTIDYSWRTGRHLRLNGRNGDAGWNHVSARVAGPLQTPVPGSFDKYIIEHYWGYVRDRDRKTREYRVLHEPWKIAPASNVAWKCDLANTYEGPWTEHLAQAPVSALIADGSSIQLFRGRRIG